MTSSARERSDYGPLHAAAFLLELMMLTILALSGAASSDSLVVQVLAAVALPVVAAAIWAVWMAPTSVRRLANPRRFAAEVVLFAISGLLAALLLALWVGAVFFMVATLVFGELARRESR